MSPSPSPLQLYVHVPFCEKKCHYCDFASWELPAARQRPWTETLLREIETRGKGLEGRPIRTVFFGGGTPSVLASEFLESLVLSLRSRFDFSQVEELSIECNPSSLNRDKLNFFHDLGFTRISLGVQSFHEAELKRLGRVHSPEGARAALQCLADDGRFEFSGDLIFGQPGQTLSSFLSSLETLLSYDPTHISFYGLTIEGGTEFDRQAQAGTLSLPEAEQYNAQYLAGVELLASRGYERYEVSNFAKPGKACLHNQGYWDGIEYLALGPGAHSLLGDMRLASPRGFEEYLQWGAQGFPAEQCEQDRLDSEALIAERVFLSLRQAKGLELAQMENDFAVSLPYATQQKWFSAEAIRFESGRIFLHDHGWLMLDEISADFLAHLQPRK
jgi:oxygen-independent coproporphyrinogen III oxidase